MAYYYAPRRRRVWPWFLGGFIVLFILGIGGCVALIGGVATSINNESKREVAITYQVQGSGRSVSIIYDGRDFNSAQDTSVSLPWSKQVTIAGLGKTVSLTATNDESGGTITCRILANGTQIAEQTASGPFASANCVGDAGQQSNASSATAAPTRSGPLSTVAASPIPPSAANPSDRASPLYQDASCPDVLMISIPGTWQSSPQLDPHNPVQFPAALLLNVTNPIRAQFGSDRLDIYTVPYTAQFHNPLAPDNQMSYNDSRAEGTRAALNAMTEMNKKCPLTSYVLTGVSQGAVIAGDIASDIGNGRGPIADDLVLGVTLISDLRRGRGVGLDVGPTAPGQGAEITLAEVPTLSALGLTMTGPRPGGFDSLNNRVNEICAQGDVKCAASEEAFKITDLPQTIKAVSGEAGQPLQALYATTQFWSLDGQSATAWTLNWAEKAIDNAPSPARR